MWHRSSTISPDIASLGLGEQISEYVYWHLSDSLDARRMPSCIQWKESSLLRHVLPQKSTLDVFLQRLPMSIDRVSGNEASYAGRRISWQLLEHSKSDPFSKLPDQAGSFPPVAPSWVWVLTDSEQRRSLGEKKIDSREDTNRPTYGFVRPSRLRGRHKLKAIIAFCWD